MPKRRTRKQKVNAKHKFAITWTPNPKKGKKTNKTSKNKASVKRQTSSSTKPKKNTLLFKKKTAYKVKVDNLASIKHNMLKSLSVAATILGLEIVIYLYLRS